MSSNKEARRIRRQADAKQICRQFRIVLCYSANSGYSQKPLGAWRKQHALNCGRSGCHMCCNPRRVFKAVTLAEVRIQDAFAQALADYHCG
ncbi:hypothetical protein DV532_27565 (plasmid) [Pseudomonas sp. Leaf58]|nr:hypothetical protein DV532_27565 [Pseudomonas sp. Leaf58]